MRPDPDEFDDLTEDPFAPGVEDEDEDDGVACPTCDIGCPEDCACECHEETEDWP